MTTTSTTIPTSTSTTIAGSLDVDGVASFFADDDAVDDDGADAVRVRDQTVGAGGEVVHAAQRGAADGTWIEDGDVGGVAPDFASGRRGDGGPAR